MMPANRSRMPWNSDDLAQLDDMVRDGFPIPAIAFRLQRSRASVQGMVKKTTATLLRGKTETATVQLLPTAYEKLKEFARLRRMTMNTFCRVVLEICSREPDWVDRLLDDMSPERNDVEEPLALEEPNNAKHNKPRVEVVPIENAPPMLTASALSQPQLVAVMH
jgi:hypothetical protein